MKVTIVSPEKTLYEGEVQGVIVPGRSGRFEILADHAPIISSLSAGIVEVRAAEPYSVEVKGGFVEAEHNEVSLCVEVK